MSTPQYGEPPKKPSKMTGGAAVPVCPFCKNKEHGNKVLEQCEEMKHGGSLSMVCLGCFQIINIQALVSKDGGARTYRVVPGYADFPKLPEEMT